MFKEITREVVKEVSRKVSKYYFGENLFYDKITERYVIDGIDVLLDYNISILNKARLKKSVSTEIPMILEAIKNLPYCIKRALKERRVPIILNDIETVRIERKSKGVAGYYCKAPVFSEIHVGLNNTPESVMVLFHEIGHFIDEEVDIIRNSFYRDRYDAFSYKSVLVAKAYCSDAPKYREYARTSPSEFIAVIFENYLFGITPDGITEAKNIIDMYMDILRSEYQIENIENNFENSYAS